ncbi:MAG: hypothetical protein H0T46_18975 [Deltaproteobacteria bacterium]|nr:hypothetical protein [Deltaproteobacteria bacterium]
MTRPTLSQIGDDWYESEESTRAGLVTELQRIRRRFTVRPIPVLLLAALITAGVVYRMSKRKKLVEAEVILALQEGALGDGAAGIPIHQMQQYVSTVLLPDKQLAALIEKKNMYSLRQKLGMQFAINELREQMEIDIWKNSFEYFDLDDSEARKSARIAITVADADPDLAYELAHDLASIAIIQHEIERERISRAVANQLQLMRDTTEKKLAEIDRAIASKSTALEQARQAGKNGLASALLLDLASIESDRKRVADQMRSISISHDGIAREVAAAGLDLSLQVVEERRPDRPEKSQFVMIMVFFVVGTGALIGAALFVGAFDSRIHDTDDVERLGLPVLGHVPGFAGDSVGSLHARGARRARVGSVMRWRSLR